MVLERIFLPRYSDSILLRDKEAKASEQSENEREYYIPPYSYVSNPGKRGLPLWRPLCRCFSECNLLNFSYSDLPKQPSLFYLFFCLFLPDRYDSLGLHVKDALFCIAS